MKLNRRDFVGAVVALESLRSPRAGASDATSSSDATSTVAVDGRAFALAARGAGERAKWVDGDAGRTRARTRARSR